MHSLDETQDRSLVEALYAELQIVLDELEVLNKQDDKSDISKIDLDIITKNRLLKTLKESASKRESRGCNDVFEEAEKYTMTAEDRELFTAIKELLRKRKYKDIVRMI
ncbi:MAG: hypothetical protein U9R27_07460 [Campylobacterota bacterium]|nr:hypothetical protein [Campylobacterota bacterium]